MKLAEVTTTDLRLAASAWRRNASAITIHRARAGILKWLIPEPDMSIYDRIDDLVIEIERLCWNEHLRKIEAISRS